MFFFYIPFPERHTNSDTMTEKYFWSCLHTLSKPWENFYVFNNIIYQKYEPTHSSIFRFLVTNLTFIFIWVQLMKDHLKIWRKNLDLLQFIMRILLAYSYFPAYNEIWSPPNLPLAFENQYFTTCAVKSILNRFNKIFGLALQL